jgi:exo-beta-1,3-glucanase (GH17 family)
MAEVDIVLFNHYPFWEGVAIREAVGAMDAMYEAVAKAARGKPIVVGETGWPSGGDSIGRAIASPENAATYLAEFTAWANLRRVPYFYFEAFDEAWKVRYEGPKGTHWGLWDEDGRPKVGLHRALSSSATSATTAGLTSGRTPRSAPDPAAGSSEVASLLRP